MRLAGAVELGVMAAVDMVVAGVQVAFVDDGQPLGRKACVSLSSMLACIDIAVSFAHIWCQGRRKSATCADSIR